MGLLDLGKKVCHIEAMLITVNMVIFAGRNSKFCENVGKTFYVGVIFMILLLFPS